MKRKRGDGVETSTVQGPFASPAVADLSEFSTFYNYLTQAKDASLPQAQEGGGAATSSAPVPATATTPAVPLQPHNIIVKEFTEKLASAETAEGWYLRLPRGSKFHSRSLAQYVFSLHRACEDESQFVHLFPIPSVRTLVREALSILLPLSQQVMGALRQMDQVKDEYYRMCALFAEKHRAMLALFQATGEKTEKAKAIADSVPDSKTAFANVCASFASLEEEEKLFLSRSREHFKVIQDVLLSAMDPVFRDHLAGPPF